MSTARNYKPSHLKKIFTLSGNNCAMPQCTKPIVSNDGKTVVGKICHIRAASLNGPRWDEKMSNDDRRDFDNLILMCSDHHDEIDYEGNLKKYTYEVLIKYKKEHEKGNVSKQFQVEQVHVDQIVDQLNQVYKITQKTYFKVNKIENTVDVLSKQIEKLFLMIEKQGGGNLNQKALDVIISEGFEGDYEWVNSERLLVLKGLLMEYNNELKSKRELLKVTHKMILSFFNVSELKEKVDEWQKFGESPKDLDQLQFISTAVMAYDFLDRIPKELIDDFKRLNYCPIHSGFFNGYLGGFIREVKMMKELGLDLENEYKGDIYFYENLTRIIRSLKLFLESSPQDYYQERSEAILMKCLPQSFLVVCSETDITLRSIDDLSLIFAKLPIDKQFHISKLIITNIENEIKIIGFNALECFYWNPEKDIVANVFFKAKPKEDISNIFVDIDTEKKIICTVQLKESLLEFNDFKEVKSEPLEKPHILFPLESGYIAMKYSYVNVKGDLIYFVDKNFNFRSILTTQKLEKILRSNFEINSWIESFESNENFEISQLLNVFQSLKLQKINYDEKELFLLKGNIRMRGILILFELVDEHIKYIDLILLQESSTVSIDTVQKEKELYICVGLLDLNRSKSICELLKFKGLVLYSRELISKDRDKFGVRDMFYTQITEDGEKIFLCEEGRTIIKYDVLIKTLDNFDNGDEYINSMKYFSRNLTLK